MIIEVISNLFNRFNTAVAVAVAGAVAAVVDTAGAGPEIVVAGESAAVVALETALAAAAAADLDTVAGLEPG